MAIFTFILFTLVIVLLGYILTPKQAVKKGCKKLPLSTNVNLPIFGHKPRFIYSLLIEKKNILKTVSERILQKKTYVFFSGFRQSVSTVDPEIVAHVLSRNFDNYRRTHRNKWIFDDFLGDGIFTSMGSHWKRLRDLSRPHFKLRNLKFNVTTLLKYCNEMDIFLNQASETGMEFDLQDLFGRYTMDSFCNLGFGVELNTINMKGKNDFASCFLYVQNEMVLRFRFTFIFMHLAKMFPSLRGEFWQRLEFINKFVYEIIEARSNESKESLMKKEDLLSRFMCAEENWSNKELRDMVLNFLLAGRDTTACLLTFTIYMLIKNKRVLDKCREEIASKAPNGPNAENEKDLVYLQYTLRETLRLYPSVPLDARECIEDDILPGGYFVPAGTQVGMNIYAMGRNPEYWHEPYEYRPERWSPEAQKTRPINHFSYIPFLAGPQRCLGQTLALLEAKLLLAKILPKYDFKLKEGWELNELPTVILVAKGGIPITVSKRN